MVDAGRLRAILDRAEVDLARLRQLASTPPEALIHEVDRLDAVKYRFITAIEGLIDAAHHVISSERLRAPSTYAEAFVVLGEAGILDDELAARRRRSPASATSSSTGMPKWMTSV